MQGVEYPAAAFARKPLSLEVGTCHYLRVETYDPDGVLLGFSNPFGRYPTTPTSPSPDRAASTTTSEPLAGDDPPDHDHEKWVKGDVGS